MRRFEEDRYYRPCDPEMRLIATEGTLAQWRYQARGPVYVRYGNRILYRGADLNRELDAHVVHPGVPDVPANAPCVDPNLPADS